MAAKRKRCTRCGETKTLTNFYTRSDGTPISRCKSCHKLGVSEWIATHRDENRAYARRSQRKRLYGMTQDEFEELLASQDYRCAICEEPERAVIRGKVADLSVDHCHVTGVVRGLLCHACNVGLGKLQDSPYLLRKGADYLEERGHAGK